MKPCMLAQFVVKFYRNESFFNSVHLICRQFVFFRLPWEAPSWVSHLRRARGLPRGWRETIRSNCATRWFISVRSLFEEIMPCWNIEEKVSWLEATAYGAVISETDFISLPSRSKLVATSSSLRRVTSSTYATEAMMPKAAPKPHRIEFEEVVGKMDFCQRVAQKPYALSIGDIFIHYVANTN